MKQTSAANNWIAGQINDWEMISRASIMVQQVKLLHTKPESHTGAAAWGLSARLPIQLSTNISGKTAKDGTSAWAATIHVGDKED